MRAWVDRAAPPVETWERRTGAAVAPLPGAPTYRRREPEKTLLHAVVRDRLELFLAAARHRSPSGRGLPTHVERDLRGYHRPGGEEERGALTRAGSQQSLELPGDLAGWQDEIDATCGHGAQRHGAHLGGEVLREDHPPPLDVS
jgi:hypothetical protein